MRNCHIGKTWIRQSLRLNLMRFAWESLQGRRSPIRLAYQPQKHRFPLGIDPPGLAEQKSLRAFALESALPH